VDRTVSTCICIFYAYIHMSINIFMCIYIYIYIYQLIFYICIDIFKKYCKLIYTYMYESINLYTNTCIYIGIYTYIYLSGKYLDNHLITTGENIIFKFIYKIHNPYISRKKVENDGKESVLYI
jgi:hypothetical protein